MKQRQNPAQPAGAGASGVRSVSLTTSLAQPRLVRLRPFRFARALSGSLLLWLVLLGCAHKTHWAPPAAALTPVEEEPVPQASSQEQLATLTPPEWIPLESVEEPKRPVRRRPTPVPSRDPGTPQPATQLASAPEPAELAIGSLSSGGDSTPQAQQQARELISAIHKRVQGLPRSVINQQKLQVRQVTSFLKQAQQALDSGDAEGAVTLATKARLLMEDIDKK